MTGSFLEEPQLSPQVQALYDEDLADGDYVWNVSRLWAHQPGTMKRLFELMSQAFTPSGLTFRQRPGSRRHLDMTPHRYPDASAGPKHSVYLGHRIRCGTPDPPEAGDDMERLRVQRQCVHIADPDVASGIPVPGHRDQPGRGVDAGAGGAAERR